MTKVITNSTCFLVAALFSMGACVMEEEGSTSEAIELQEEFQPELKEVAPSDDSDSEKNVFSGTLHEYGEGESVEIEVIPPDSDFGRDDSREFGSDLSLPPIIQDYKCDMSKNYIRYVDFKRVNLHPVNGSVLDCQKDCNKNTDFCTGFFYVDAPGERYCGFVSTTPADGLWIWVDANKGSQVCFAQR